METLYFNLLDHPTWDIMNMYVCIYNYIYIYMCVCARVRVRVCVWSMKFRSNVSWEWVFQPLGSSFIFTSAFLRLSKQHFCSILDKETPCLRPKPWQKSACWPSVVVSGISGAWPVVVESLYYNGSINNLLIWNLDLSSCVIPIIYWSNTWLFFQ